LDGVSLLTQVPRIWRLNIACYTLSGLAQNVLLSTVRQLTLTSKSYCDVWCRDARRRCEWRRYFYQLRHLINTQVLYCVRMSNTVDVT